MFYVASQALRIGRIPWCEAENRSAPAWQHSRSHAQPIVTRYCTKRDLLNALAEP